MYIICMCIQKNAFTYLKLFSIFCNRPRSHFFFLQHEPVFDKRIIHWEEKCGIFDLGVWGIFVVVLLLVCLPHLLANSVLHLFCSPRCITTVFPCVHLPVYNLATGICRPCGDQYCRQKPYVFK